MQGTIISLKADGTKQVTNLNRAPTLDDIKSAIGGGHIELVSTFNAFRHEGNYFACAVFCDEEGKIKQLPVNKYATVLWANILRCEYSEMLDYIAGDIAIVFGDSEFESEL